MSDLILKRTQVALAHLFANGYFDTSTFPLGGREKYLSAIATEVRKLFKDTGIDADLAKFRVGDNVGWIMWPNTEHPRCENIGGVVVGSNLTHYVRELNRLLAERAAA